MKGCGDKMIISYKGKRSLFVTAPFTFKSSTLHADPRLSFADFFTLLN